MLVTLHECLSLSKDTLHCKGLLLLAYLLLCTNTIAAVATGGSELPDSSLVNSLHFPVLIVTKQLHFLVPLHFYYVVCYVLATVRHLLLIWTAGFVFGECI